MSGFLVIAFQNNINVSTRNFRIKTLQSIVVGLLGPIFPRATAIGGCEILRDIVHGSTVCGVSHRTVKKGTVRIIDAV